MDFGFSTAFERLGLRALVAGLALAAACRERDAARLVIRYPEPGQSVRHDEIPVWLSSAEPELFDRMKVLLNGEDVTWRFLPSGGRTLQDPESVGVIRPAVGENEVEVTVGGPEEPELRETVRFRFEPEPLRVVLRVLEDGRDVPARVSFHGLDGTEDPTLAPSVWREIAHPRFVREEREHERGFVYTRGAPYELHLPAGRYEVLASRGPAYSLARAEVGPEGGEVELRIRRIVDTGGWISADFHVHAIPSLDSALSLAERVASYAAQDVDVIVASDHHTITDYEADLGPERMPEGLVTIPGIETSYRKSGGHWGFWPLARDESDATYVRGVGSRAYGGFRHYGSLRTPSALYAHFRALNAGARRERFGEFPVVIQLNHPRGIRFARDEPNVYHSFAYLEHAGYDPGQPLDAVANGALLARESPEAPRAIDVDAIELLNRLAYDLYFRVRGDWFAWMREGVVTTATSNSDSHWLVLTEAGYPRNWVRYTGPLPVQAQGLAGAVRARQVVGGTGPLLILDPWPEDGAPWRGPLRGLSVTVRAAPWMAVRVVRVYVNGELVRRVAAPEFTGDPYGERAQEFRVEVPLSVERDAFVTVEAGDTVKELVRGGVREGPLARTLPDVGVLAFTNALLVDADGDGRPWGAPSRP
jgi:hypothetical protein